MKTDKPVEGSESFLAALVVHKIGADGARVFQREPGGKVVSCPDGALSPVEDWLCDLAARPGAPLLLDLNALIYLDNEGPVEHGDRMRLAPAYVVGIRAGHRGGR